MIPTGCPQHLNAATQQCFQQVRNWLATEMAGSPKPLLVGIGGPGGCGKSTLTRWLRHHVDGARILSLDDFRLPRNQRVGHGRFGSHPAANDLSRLRDCLADFRAGRPVRQPVFDPGEGRVPRDLAVADASVLLADGEIAAHRDMRAEWDRLVLVQAHWRTQLNTRLTRDLRERSFTLEKAIDVFLHSNLRDYPRFAAGAEKDAHVILHRNAKNVFGLRRLPR